MLNDPTVMFLIQIEILSNMKLQDGMNTHVHLDRKTKIQSERD